MKSRKRLPRPTDRVVLGGSGVSASPFCLGMVPRPEIVEAAYDAGVNFFFVTADMHWPDYGATRAGIAALLQRRPSLRKDIVVAVVSYVTQPEFCHAPFDEVLEAIPDLEHIDVAVIGGTYPTDFLVRRAEYLAARQGQWRALGATFHDRSAAVAAMNHDLVDVAFLRYNARHPGAEVDVFPHLRHERRSVLYNFTSTSGHVSSSRMDALRIPKDRWRPSPADHYRFVLRRPEVDGILCAFSEPAEVAALAPILKKGPLTDEEAAYLKTLAQLDLGLIEVATERPRARKR